MRIVDTDNFGGDYPDEKFVLWPMSEPAAKDIAQVLNTYFSSDTAPRYFKVVDNDYQLAPGFEP
jgi:hypothetical protein